ncbi:MAG: trigger factor [Bacteroidales bacterium]|nr:trigger factor [Bacteroidales bacterium]
MELLKNQIDELNLTLTINVSKEDLTENIEKTLKEYRQKAEIRGYRRGNAPLGLIKKMYGKAVLADELNKFVGKSLSDYIENEKLDILGEPLPNEGTKTLDLDADEKFEFIFDLGIAPAFDVKLTKRDKFCKYSIVPAESDIEKQIENYKNQYGKYTDQKKADEKSLLTGCLMQIAEDGSELENAMKNEEANLAIEFIKDEKIKKNFIGATVDTIIDFDIKKAFEGEDGKIAIMLKGKKEDVANMSPKCRLVVKTIKNYQQAEVNQDLFDKCFEKDTVKTEEEFKAKVAENIKESLVRESKYKTLDEIREKLLGKLDIKLPEEFLKRWVKATNEKLSDEEIENEFPRFLNDLRWTLISNKIAKAGELKIEKEEIESAAKEMILAQFAQYGMAYLPDEYAEKYVKQVLGDKDQVRRLYEQKMEEKIADYVLEQTKVEDVEMTIEELVNSMKK